MDANGIADLAAGLRERVGRVVVGQNETMDLMLTALLSGGHILLEGVPGTAKTLIAQCFAASLEMRFGRIQFTPDLMPGDLLGTNLFNFQTNEFSLKKGPIFTQVLLADEINRTPPKTQAALLEAMNERRVTIDGETHPLGHGFLVIATQNPIEQQGTYPLPEAQSDRFLFKHVLTYPDRDQEREIVRLHGHAVGMPSAEEAIGDPVADLATIRAARDWTAKIRIGDDIIDYIVDVIRSTREHSSLQFGASPRAAKMLATASRARAALDGRDFVLPDDVKALALPALRHRIVLSPAAEIEGVEAGAVIQEILDRVAAPR